MGSGSASHAQRGRRPAYDRHPMRASAPGPTLATGLSLAPFRGLAPERRRRPAWAGCCARPTTSSTPAHAGRPARGRPGQRGRGDPARTDDRSGRYAARRSASTTGCATGCTPVDDEPALYVYEMRDARRRADPRAARRGGTARPGRRRHPAAREHDGRPGRRPAGADDRHRGRSRADLPGLRRRRRRRRTLCADGRRGAPLAEATTADGVDASALGRDRPGGHAARWPPTWPRRRALIADGHHRYATYRELQRRLRRRPRARTVGPRACPARRLHRATARRCTRSTGSSPALALADAVDGRRRRLTVRTADRRRWTPRSPRSRRLPGFAAVLTDGDAQRASSPTPTGGRAAGSRAGEPAALADLDVTVLHRALVEQVWGLADDVDTVGYAHIGGRGAGATPEHAAAPRSCCGPRRSPPSPPWPRPAPGCRASRRCSRPSRRPACSCVALPTRLDRRAHASRRRPRNGWPGRPALRQNRRCRLPLDLELVARLRPGERPADPRR